MYGYASSTIANSGLPTNAIPSNTEMARITSAKYGGIRKGNLNVISAKSAANSWKLILLAPPPAKAASNTLASAGMIGAVSVPKYYFNVIID